MLICFLLPYIQIIISKDNFCVTGLDILVGSKLSLVYAGDGTGIYFPNIMKISVLLGALSPLVGVLFILLKKNVLAAGSFIVGAITPIFSLLTVSDLKRQIFELNISSNRAYIGFI